MILISEAIQRIKSLYNKGVQSDDSRLSSRHIYNKLLSVRSRLIYQKVNKKQKLSQWVYQTLPCVELIKAPIHECPCIPSGKCVILRTKYKLPKPISSLDKDIIQSVSSLDGSTIFNETTFETEKYTKGNKYTSTKPHYYIRNEYLYITDTKSLEAITITGLFDDPVAVEEHPSYCEDKTSCPECECKSAIDREFPIDSDLIDPMIELSLQELIEVFSQMREDQTNDARDNLIQESKS